jgi:hypothetical protein
LTLTDDLWVTASHDQEAEVQQRRIALCRTAALSIWPVLAAATTPQDFVNRKAVVSERLDKAVSSVIADPALFAVARAELEATLDADYEVVHRARTTAAYQQAAELRRQRLFAVTQR